MGSKMNEKIKLLADQAGFVLWKNEFWNPGDTVDWSCRYDDELEKFAQLIVKECSEIVLNCGIIGSNNERDFIVASREIKHHFEIEE
jgi:hypothetical protein